MVRKGMVKIIGNTGVSVTNAHMSTETGESIQHRFRAGNQLPDRFPNNAEHGGVALVVPRRNLQPPFHPRRNSTRNKSESNQFRIEEVSNT
jgi:transposase